MTCDLYVHFRIETKEDIEDLTSGKGKYSEITDVLTKIFLLNTVFGVKEKFPDNQGRPDRIEPEAYAKVGERNDSKGLMALIHSNGNYNDLLQCRLSTLNLIEIDKPIEIDGLPTGSWAIEFPITLRTPFYSKDDIHLYIIENPMRKDKVFGVPFTSAMAWKGNLRWTMMKVHLEPAIDEPKRFAEIRFNHTLLFGTEKGMEEQPSGWTEYLDNLCEKAVENYRNKLKEYFSTTEIFSLKGMLYFYPTFWNRIDMEVINPHDRETKTGKNPIYYEVVPAGATGVFRLLYIPIHYIGRYSEIELLKKAKEDLRNVIVGLKEMMLTYGFSAKKSIGYGVIEETWDSTESRLSFITGKKPIYYSNFKNFEELENLVNQL